MLQAGTILVFSSLAAIKSRARKEMEAERKNVDQNIDTFTYSEEENTSAEVPTQLATSGIFFQCPMIGEFLFYIY